MILSSANHPGDHGDPVIVGRVDHGGASYAISIRYCMASARDSRFIQCVDSSRLIWGGDAPDLIIEIELFRSVEGDLVKAGTISQVSIGGNISQITSSVAAGERFDETLTVLNAVLLCLAMPPFFGAQFQTVLDQVVANRTALRASQDLKEYSNKEPEHIAARAFP